MTFFKLQYCIMLFAIADNSKRMNTYSKFLFDSFGIPIPKIKSQAF